MYEATISTIEDSPETAAWFSQPQLDEERAGNSAESEASGPKTPDAGLRAMSPEAQALRLPRSKRLKRARDFAEIRRQGRRLALGCLIANWQLLPPGSASRIGVVTSRKLGPAAVRSRARRLLREAFRLHQHDLLRPAAIVLVGRQSLAGAKFERVERDFMSALRRAGLLEEQ
jgi:ribonuclease P protein component